jgi:pyruvate kinase
MLLNGLDVARFNFSHGGPGVQAEHIENLRRVSEEIDVPVAILQDLQGPKIRTGPLQSGIVELQMGQTFTLTTRGVAGDEKEVSTTYQALPCDCRRGDTILLDDGNIALQVESVTDTDVVCTVTDPGTLKPNKGINLPGVAVSAPAMSEKDRHDVEWGLKNGVDYVALSFVRRAEDVLELRELINAHGSTAKIIAKLEKPEAIRELEPIIAAADGVMVARGDLGVEMPPEEVPLLQKLIIRTANRMDKLVITATQMLESMTNNQRPTRAEASDVANAVLDGTDALMLSGETAAGAYPLESLQMMSRIIEQVESQTNSGWQQRRRTHEETCDFTGAICEAAAHAAAALNARAIACFTESGTTAVRLAKFKPPVPIVAFTLRPEVARALQLVWGVQPHLIESHASTDELIMHTDQILMQCGVVEPGDVVVVTLGAPVTLGGSTNLLKVHRVGESGLA